MVLMPKKKSKGRSKKKTSSKGKATKSVSKKDKSGKLEYYADKLYRGLIKLYREKEEQNIFSLSLTRGSRAFDRERKSPGNDMRKAVLRKFNDKCAICGRRFKPSDASIEFHHVNGDREKTTIENLIPLCATCHKDVHSQARAKFQSYKQRKEKEKGKSIWDMPLSRSTGKYSLSKSSLKLGQSIWDMPTSKKGKRKKSDSIWDSFKWP